MDDERHLTLLASYKASSEQQRTELEEVREELAKARAEAEDWHAWQELLGEVGDLFHRARAKPKGKRYVTVLELGNLLQGPTEPRSS